MEDEDLSAEEEIEELYQQLEDLYERVDKASTFAKCNSNCEWNHTGDARAKCKRDCNKQFSKKWK